MAQSADAEKDNKRAAADKVAADKKAQQEAKEAAKEQDRRVAEQEKADQKARKEGEKLAEKSRKEVEDPDAEGVEQKNENPVVADNEAPDEDTSDADQSSKLASTAKQRLLKSQQKLEVKEPEKAPEGEDVPDDRQTLGDHRMLAEGALLDSDPAGVVHPTQVATRPVYVPPRIVDPSAINQSPLAPIDGSTNGATPPLGDPRSAPLPDSQYAETDGTPLVNGGPNHQFNGVGKPVNDRIGRGWAGGHDGITAMSTAGAVPAPAGAVLDAPVPAEVALEGAVGAPTPGDVATELARTATVIVDEATGEPATEDGLFRDLGATGTLVVCLKRLIKETPANGMTSASSTLLIPAGAQLSRQQADIVIAMLRAQA